MMRYAVLIVNYRCADRTRNAVGSVIANATDDIFGVVVVDNSAGGDAHQSVGKIHDGRVHIVDADTNLGFGAANNLAAKVAQERWRPDYFVIMNPDVEIEQPGTVERLLDTIAEDPCSVGAQPLVWNSRVPGLPSFHVQVRSIPTYADILICESIVLRFIFRDAFRRYIMADKLPYSDILPFQVPSGAFFVISATVFLSIGGFDDAMFLYGEEFVIGKKVLDIGKWFVLNPNLRVRHYQGASTGFEYQSAKWDMYRHRISSNLYFCRHYLGTTHTKCFVLLCCMVMSYGLRFVYQTTFMRFLRRRVTTVSVRDTAA